MLYKITTESGAVYAVDTGKKVAARLSGDPAKKSVFVDDGEYRPYFAVAGICVGSRLGIFWTADKFRVTSPVVKVENEPEPSQLVAE